MRGRTFSSMNSPMSNFGKNFESGQGTGFRRGAASTFLLVMLASFALAQQPILTSRADSTRSGANTNETLLMPSTVKTGLFGLLFSVPLDYQSLAQPLFVPNVNIGGQAHNVIYVVTQSDMVYAIDADHGGSPLWTANITDGGVPASGKYLPCGVGGGFTQEGIIGTPVIDQNTGTMYLVAKSVFNGTVHHYLHALDITTGIDQVPPTVISASSTSVKGHTTVFNSLHQKNRPGLLLVNGTLYLGFGSNGCNDGNSGWVLAYDVSNMANINQTGVFNTSPDTGLTSIWQTGNGLAADEAGNLYVATAESSNYDVPAGGQSFCNSILKLSPAPWTSSPTQPQLADYFTPASVAYLNSHDLDVSSVGPVVVPDLDGTYPHEVIASSKEGIVYVINRDEMGWYSAAGDNIIQEFTLSTNGELMSSPAYWNGTVYFLPDGSPIQAYTVSNGQWTPSAQTAKTLVGASSPAISSNGNTNGILWQISGTLNAYDAVTLAQLYASPANLPKRAHFATPTIANGHVYVATLASLEVYGLLDALSVASGNNQSAPAMTALPAPVQFVAKSPYDGQTHSGVTVTFSDGKKGGIFNPATAVTDSNGIATTYYTLPKIAGTYTVTASGPGFATATATETATASAVAKLVGKSGSRQTGNGGTTLPNPLVVEAEDAYNNPVAGVTVVFTPVTQGTVNPVSVATDGNGMAQTYFQLPMQVGTFSVSASTAGAKNVAFSETVIAGTPTTVTVTAGNDQTQAHHTLLKKALTVVVTDQYGALLPGIKVTFSDGGAGGTFSAANPATTTAKGIATQKYTLPMTSGAVTITATVGGVATAASFTEDSQ